jgi:hypothetical protein
LPINKGNATFTEWLSHFCFYASVSVSEAILKESALRR